MKNSASKANLFVAIILITLVVADTVDYHWKVIMVLISIYLTFNAWRESRLVVPTEKKQRKYLPPNLFSNFEEMKLF